MPGKAATRRTSKLKPRTLYEAFGRKEPSVEPLTKREMSIVKLESLPPNLRPGDIMQDNIGSVLEKPTTLVCPLLNLYTKITNVVLPA